MKTTRKPIPYDFILESLASREPWTRPMFGCTAVYVGEKLVLILREKEKQTEDNGIWIATRKEHHEDLRPQFPNMRSITVFGDVTDWQLLSPEFDDFEEKAELVCELILSGDERIGRIPKKRLPSRKKGLVKKSAVARKAKIKSSKMKKKR
ncbi:MAG: hypothetical protein KDD22_00270 [Bdellovibrionales bacterium]|nr:hypothetical protein [Bdellovibrionales bacterium]